MCGFGAILIEATLMAKNIAPVLLNKKFKIFNSKFMIRSYGIVYYKLLKAHKKLLMPIIQYYDIDNNVLDKLQRNSYQTGGGIL